jgi:hypothetical protein
LLLVLCYMFNLRLAMGGVSRAARTTARCGNIPARESPITPDFCQRRICHVGGDAHEKGKRSIRSRARLRRSWRLPSDLGGPATTRGQVPRWGVLAPASHRGSDACVPQGKEREHQEALHDEEAEGPVIKKEVRAVSSRPPQSSECSVASRPARGSRIHAAAGVCVRD